MKKILPILSVLILSISPAVFAKTEAGATKTPLPDNPSLWRVLLYKTGQGINKTGDAIQRGAENSSQSIAQGSEKANERIEQSANATGQFVKEKTTQAKTYTQDKVQQGKEAIVGTPNNGTVPIEQGTLSQPTIVPSSKNP